MSHARLLIIETGEPLSGLRRHGDFPHWIRVAAGVPAQAVQVCRAHRGEALPPPGRHRAAVITGSAAMVTQRHDWSESIADWLRASAEHDVAILGICYGHQLLAHAFGGSVGDNPCGREMGTVGVQLHPAARDDVLFRGLPHRIHAHATHVQSVLTVPAGARVLAASNLDACQAFRLGTRPFWGLQFHPEFGTRAMRGYIAGRSDQLRAEGHDPRLLGHAVRATPFARRILSRFARLASPWHRDPVAAAPSAP